MPPCKAARGRLGGPEAPADGLPDEREDRRWCGTRLARLSRDTWIHGRPKIITAQPLTSRAFEPFGEFFCRLTEPGRAYTEAAPGNGRPAARPSLSMALKRPLAQLPLAVFELERHAQSSQTFVPIDAGRWLMSVGLHMRLIGHPARAVGLQRLLDYLMAREDVWITRRVDIARHWQRMHPYPGKGLNE